MSYFYSSNMLDNSKDHIKEFIAKEGIRTTKSTAILPIRSNDSDLDQDSDQKLNINDIILKNFIK